MLRHEPQYAIDLARAKAAGLGEVHRVQPGLEGRFGLVDVDMRRLVRFMAVEVEAVSVMAENSGHYDRLLFRGAHSLCQSRRRLKRLNFSKPYGLQHAFALIDESKKRLPALEISALSP